MTYERELQKILLAASPVRRKAILLEIARVARRDIDNNIKKQQDVDGSRLQPRARMHERHGRRVLQHWKGKAKIETTPEQARVYYAGRLSAWGRVHNEGETSTIRTRGRLKRIAMPERRFFGINAETAKKIIDTLADKLLYSK